MAENLVRLFFERPKRFWLHVLVHNTKLLRSDSIYLKLKWALSDMPYKLNLDNPKSFNEKLQWMKIHNRKAIYTTMVDKDAAKDYVASRIGVNHIIKTLASWKSPNDIDWSTLPNKFVLKTTHDSGGLVICRDKDKLDKEKAYTKIKKSLERDYYWMSREWPYKNVPKRIIAEEYMEQADGSPLIDYKFFCFNGKPEFLYVSQGLENHETARMSFLTMEWTFAPFHRSDYRPFDTLPQKPVLFDEMVQIASKLSAGHPFLRVDLYEIKGQIYFSELTFTPCSGMLPFEPLKWDYILGDYITL